MNEKICNLYVDRPRKFSVQHTRIAQTRTPMIVAQLYATGQLDPPIMHRIRIAYTFTTSYTRCSRSLYHFISAWYEHWTASSEQKRKKSNWLTSLVRLSYADPIQLIFLYIAMRLSGSIYIKYGVAYTTIHVDTLNCRTFLSLISRPRTYTHILSIHIKFRTAIRVHYRVQSTVHAFNMVCLDLWFKLDWICTAFSAPLRLISY